MTDRARAVNELLARAKSGGKRVFGFSSREKASCAEAVGRKGVDEGWDFLCAEGDERWTRIPVAEIEPVKEAG